MVSGEPDFQKRIKALTDLWYIKGVLLQDPTVAACVPISVENAALAYNAATDRFKVDIEAMTVGAIETTIANDWTRELGQVDIARVLGAALSHANPVIARLTDGAAFIDPRDVSDRATRQLGKVYGGQGYALVQDPGNFYLMTYAVGNKGNPYAQRADTFDSYVQLRHNAAEIDPRVIRALTATDIVTVVQSTPANLTATVTQAAKDRTISSIDATATPYQISNTFAGAGNYTVRTPASGKKIRLKFISLELSAAVDLGYRFAAGGTIYYLRTTAGPYVSNLMGCNNEGAADEALILNASGACTVKGYVLIQEV